MANPGGSQESAIWINLQYADGLFDNPNGILINLYVPKGATKVV